MSEEHRRRALLAVLIPLGALAAIAVFLWSMSRILLSAAELVSPVIALLFALNILIAAALAATFRRRRGVVAAFVVAVLVPVLAVGIVGAVAGEREFHSLVEEDGPDGPEPDPSPTEEPTDEPTEEPTDEPTEEPTGEPSDGPTEATIVAVNIQFDTDSMELAANAEVTVTFDNQDTGVPHNWAMYTDESASQEIFVGEIFPGPEVREHTFTTPGPGEYYFRCDVHPNMQGTVTVG